MIRGRHLRAPSEPAPDTEERGVTFAWKAHTAITDWTAKVDSKAAIVLSAGGVLLGFLVTLSGNGRVLAHLTGSRLLVERTGLGSIGLGVFLAALVVAPRLNRHASKKDWQSNFVYFGHLRHWKPVDLKGRLKDLSLDQELEVLSAQLVATSEIAWSKHSKLQSGMWLLLGGVVLVVCSAAWPK